MNIKQMPYIFVCVFFVGCYSQKHYEEKIIRPVLEENKVTEIQKEKDNIFTLLAFSIVYKDWQAENIPRKERRGYNIGALLVNPQNQPVRYDLNCINSTDNCTQHGEVRVITGYIEETKCFDLANHTIYTTLEPCIMCAGMITMTSIHRAVFGQRDVEYSRAFERLAIDTRPIGGFPPYPRNVITQLSGLSFTKELDEAYMNFLQNTEEKILAKFLVSEKARDIYRRASESFLSYKVKHPENQITYQSALDFFKQ